MAECNNGNAWSGRKEWRMEKLQNVIELKDIRHLHDSR